jgi:hypothetical protein
MLNAFDGIPTAYINYLKVDTATVPGTGMIIIDDSVMIGFAVRGQHVVDYGFLLTGVPDLVRKLISWFDGYVLHNNVAGLNIVQNITGGIRASNGLDELEHFARGRCGRSLFGRLGAIRHGVRR